MENPPSRKPERRGTTAKVVCHTHCPVLVVPAFERGFMVGASIERRADR